MESLFVVNLGSGRPDKGLILKDLNLLKDVYGARIEILELRASDFKDGFWLERATIARKVFAVGGDGTFNGVASQLIDSELMLGVVPIGSGNGFARELGYSRGKKAIDFLINTGSFYWIDALRINDAWCFNVAGLGFDARVARAFAAMPGRGSLNYGKAAVDSFLNFKPFYAEVDCDGVVIKDVFFLIAIANTKQFGNNAIVSPFSNPCDGCFEVVLIRPFPLLFLPQFVHKLFAGLLSNSKYITVLRCFKDCVIESNEHNMHIDGEPVDNHGVLRISMRPRCLRMVSPI